MSSRRDLLLKYGNIPKPQSSKPKKKKNKVKIIDESAPFAKSDDEDRPQIVDETQEFQSKFKNHYGEVAKSSKKSPSLSPRSRKSPSLSPTKIDINSPEIQDYSGRRPRSRSPEIERRIRHRRSPSMSPEKHERSRKRSKSPPYVRTRRSISKSPEPKPIQHETIYRDRTGRKIDLKAQELEIEEEKRKQAVEQRFQNTFSSGMVQNESRLKMEIELENVKDRSIAVYRDNDELDKQLKSKIHWDDPMAKPKKAKKSKKDKTKKSISSRPEYEGPAPPNRFGIRPGYRWDGIDRSNGFEVKLFRARDRDTELRDEYHKWATEDM